MAISRNHLLLGLALLVTLGLTWKTAQEDAAPEIALPTRVASGTLSTATQVPPVTLALKQRLLVEMRANLFAGPARSVVVPRQAPRKIAALPAAAPALPFKYLGRWQAGGAQTVSLDYRGEVLTVQAGDVIAGQYKLVTINEGPAGLQIQFLYTPLNQTQVMHIGTAP
jgi:hypothetical protein